jgi:hypothetical protein
VYLRRGSLALFADTLKRVARCLFAFLTRPHLQVVSPRM